MPEKNPLLQVVSKKETEDAPEPEETVASMTELAEVTESEDVTEEDIAATSKIIKSLVTSGAARKVKDEKEIESIVAVSTGACLLLLSVFSRIWDCTH